MMVERTTVVDTTPKEVKVAKEARAVKAEKADVVVGQDAPEDTTTQVLSYPVPYIPAIMVEARDTSSFHRNIPLHRLKERVSLLSSPLVKERDLLAKERDFMDTMMNLPTTIIPVMAREARAPKEAKVAKDLREAKDMAKDMVKEAKDLKEARAKEAKDIKEEREATTMLLTRGTTNN